MDLFSGIGGFALASSWVWGDEYENVGHSEVEPYACKVYHRHFPGSPCLGDITKIKWTEGQADLITGGFPCPSFSLAGKRRGKEDVRYLWPEMFRSIRDVKPRFVLAENVYGLVTHDGGAVLDEIYANLESASYETLPPIIVPACAVAAPHKRDRVWILAHTRYDRRGPTNGESQEARAQITKITNRGRKVSLADAGGEGLSGSAQRRKRGLSSETEAFEGGSVDGGVATCRAHWEIEPNVGRVAHGVSSKLDGGLDEALRVLWQGNDSPEMVKREIRRQLEGSPVLLDQMLRRLDYLSEQGETVEWEKKGAAPFETNELRDVWLRDWITEASRGSEHAKQRSIQPENSLPEVSQRQSPERWDMGNIWVQEPDIPRVAHGVVERVNRLKGLGNAIVPQVAAVILQAIKDSEVQ